MLKFLVVPYCARGLSFGGKKRTNDAGKICCVGNLVGGMDGTE